MNMGLDELEVLRKAVGGTEPTLENLLKFVNAFGDYMCALIRKYAQGIVRINRSGASAGEVRALLDAEMERLLSGVFPNQRLDGLGSVPEHGLVVPNSAVIRIESNFPGDFRRSLRDRVRREIEVLSCEFPEFRAEAQSPSSAQSEPASDSAHLRQGGNESMSIAAERHAAVRAYIAEVLSRTGKRITKKDIWESAGYRFRSEFERWQRNDLKYPNKMAAERFAAILTEKPHLK